MKYHIIAILLLICGTVHADLSPTQELSVMEVRNDYKRMGTAFAMEGGRIVTAYHVIEGEPVAKVVYNGVVYPCTVVKIVPKWDMAILKAEGLRVIAPLKWDREVAIGQPVMVYGFPSGAGYSRSPGHVTDTDEELWHMWGRRPAGTTTALVRGGYSGGPVVDRRTNRVIGILTNQEPSIFRRDTGGLFTRVDQVRGY